MYRVSRRKGVAKLSRRTKKIIAELLLEAGMSYRYIARELGMSFSDIAEVSKKLRKGEPEIVDLPVILKDIREALARLSERADCILRTFSYNRLPVWCCNCQAYARLVYDKESNAWVCPLCGKRPF